MPCLPPRYAPPSAIDTLDVITAMFDAYLIRHAAFCRHMLSIRYATALPHLRLSFVTPPSACRHVCYAFRCYATFFFFLPLLMLATPCRRCHVDVFFFHDATAHSTPVTMSPRHYDAATRPPF